MSQTAATSSEKQAGAVLLVAHSWDGAVITEACGHPQVRGAIYIGSGPDTQLSLSEWLKEFPVVGNSLAPGETLATSKALTWKNKPTWFIYGAQGDQSGPSGPPM